MRKAGGTIADGYIWAFLSHVLRNFIEESLAPSNQAVDGIFLSHVLRNFIEDGILSNGASVCALFLSHVLRNFIEDGGRKRRQHDTSDNS